MITGGGNPVALQGNVRFCFSFTVITGEGFETKCGDSVNILKHMVHVMTLSRMRFEFVREWAVTPVFKHQRNSQLQVVIKASYYAPGKLSQRNRMNVLKCSSGQS